MNGIAQQRRLGAVVIAVLALLGCLLLGLHGAQSVMRSYLAAYVFFLSPALGSVALLMVHRLAGNGDWGRELYAPLLAASRMLPLLALLLLPILFGAIWLYPWMQVVVPGDPDIAQQRWYLNRPFFVLRAVVCFAMWLWLAHGLARRLRDPRLDVSLPCFSAIGLIVYLLTISVAAVDWVMSLVPAWHSSIFGLIVATGQLLAAAALGVWCRTGHMSALPPAIRRGDLGSLLLVLLLAWSYLVFMDYLTVWIADLPSETVWYLPKLLTSWRWVGAWLVVFQLLLPLAVLLSRRAKQRRLWLRSIAALLLLAQAVYVLWLVLPDPSRRGFALTWGDALAWLGIGALCWALFDLRLAQARVETGATS
ncbi:MAG TPA: hypothetical protein VGG00_00930 [Rhodanobacter sp.]